MLSMIYLDEFIYHIINPEEPPKVQYVSLPFLPSKPSNHSQTNMSQHFGVYTWIILLSSALGLTGAYAYKRYKRKKKGGGSRPDQSGVKLTNYYYLLVIII